MANNAFNALREFKLSSGKTGKYYSLAALEEAGLGKVSRLPVSLRVVLESVLRNCDGERISEERVRELAGWKPKAERTQEIPFVLARIMLQDMAGFPALNDFAAMRAEAKRQNFEPTKIKPGTPAGKWLGPFGTPPSEWGHFGTRRCNHELMIRGTFANVRLRNQLAPGTEGPVTKHQPDGEEMTIFDASEKYRAESTPLVIFGGEDFGMGSSRDWAAKGIQLLGVRAVIVRSFERIHRANLIGMGVLPLQFKAGDSVQSLKIDGTETFSIEGVNGGNVKPLQDVTMVITRADGKTQNVLLTLRIDTGIEVDYLKHDGILPYVLRELLAAA